jgi:hypothetical protein
MKILVIGDRLGVAMEPFEFDFSVLLCQGENKSLFLILWSGIYFMAPLIAVALWSIYLCVLSHS